MKLSCCPVKTTTWRSSGVRVGLSRIQPTQLKRLHHVLQPKLCTTTPDNKLTAVTPPSKTTADDVQAQSEHAVDHSPSVTISMEAGGWLVCFHIGVARFLCEHVDLENPRLRFAGSSCGSFIAAALCLNVSPDVMLARMVGLHEAVHHKPFDMCAMAERVLEETMPQTSDESWRTRTNDRLAVSVSTLTWKGLYGIVVTTYRGREHALRIFRASYHLPVLGGILPYDGCYDGGLTIPVPRFGDEDVVVEVLPRALPDMRNAVIGSGVTSIPPTWSYLPPDTSKLLLLDRLGYLQAAKLFMQRTDLRYLLKKVPDIKDIDKAIADAKGRLENPDISI